MHTRIAGMDQIETLPGFNSELKMQEEPKAEVAKPKPSPSPKQEMPQDDGELGFNMFEEQAAAEKPAPKLSKVSVLKFITGRRDGISDILKKTL